MLKAPKFWYKENESNFSKILYPASLLYRLGTNIYNILNTEYKVQFTEHRIHST